MSTRLLDKGVAINMALHEALESLFIQNINSKPPFLEYGQIWTLKSELKVETTIYTGPENAPQPIILLTNPCQAPLEGFSISYDTDFASSNQDFYLPPENQNFSSYPSIIEAWNRVTFPDFSLDRCIGHISPAALIELDTLIEKSDKTNGSFDNEGSDTTIKLTSIFRCNPSRPDLDITSYREFRKKEFDYLNSAIDHQERIKEFFPDNILPFKKNVTIVNSTDVNSSDVNSSDVNSSEYDSESSPSKSSSHSENRIFSYMTGMAVGMAAFRPSSQAFQFPGSITTDILSSGLKCVTDLFKDKKSNLYDGQNPVLLFKEKDMFAIIFVPSSKSAAAGTLVLMDGQKFPDLKINVNILNKEDKTPLLRACLNHKSPKIPIDIDITDNVEIEIEVFPKGH